MLPRITGLPRRTAKTNLPGMFIRLRSDPAPDEATAFRAYVRRLGRPERDRTEAARMRIILARARRVGLRERLAEAVEVRR